MVMQDINLGATFSPEVYVPRLVKTDDNRTEGTPIQRFNVKE